MLFNLLLFIAAASAAAVPSLEARATPEAIVTAWRQGCGNYECGTNLGCSYGTTYGEGFPSNQEECYAVGYGYNSLQLNVLDENDNWSVDVFSGEGCNNPIGVGVFLPALSPVVFSSLSIAAFLPAGMRFCTKVRLLTR
jgi:hypothetical protein